MTTLSSNTTHPTLSSRLYVIVITKTSPSCLTFTMITVILVFVLHLHTENSDHRNTQLPFVGSSLLENRRSLLFLNDWSVHLMAKGWFRLNFDVWLVCVDVWGLFENANRLKYRTRNLQFSFLFNCRKCPQLIVFIHLLLSLRTVKQNNVFISNLNLNFTQNYVKQYKQDCTLRSTWGPSNNASVSRQGQR